MLFFDGIVKRKEKEDPKLIYSVMAYQGFPQEFVDKSAAVQTGPGAFQGFPVVVRFDKRRIAFV